MKLMLIGYGKMGKTIEQIAIKRGHEVVYKIGRTNADLLKSLTSNEVDVAIEFTQPESAFENVRQCIENGIPVVCGTTGWLERRKEIEELCAAKNGAFFYASNFSIGVNIFFHLNKVLAKMMNHYPEYEVSTEEIHHTAKKDAPSGTAITIAEGIIENLPRKTQWVNFKSMKPEELSIISQRIDPYPGKHTVTYNSIIDTIEISHNAHSRDGFAGGAVFAGEWLIGKKGVFGMDDMLQLDNK